MYARGDCDNGLGSVAGWLVVVPLHFVDLPISLVTDTVMVPCDMRRKAKKTREASNKAQEETARKLADPQR